MFSDLWCQGCLYNTNKYANGCECFEGKEPPYLCNNLTIEKTRKNEVEAMIEIYRKMKENSSPYVAFSGACGKYCRNI
jgi:hypothetical protein